MRVEDVVTVRQLAPELLVPLGDELLGALKRLVHLVSSRQALDYHSPAVPTS